MSTRATVQRRILHCDMDCFYAAVHMRDDPTLVGKPVVIGGDPRGRGVVAAANYEVRRFGVHSAMPCAQAQRLCPHAVFLKPEFSRYQEESKLVFEVFHQLSPLVQPVSIDEAYLDVTESWPEWGSATALAKEIRRRVREERNLTVSIGVAPNRLVAKIASDFDKPDGLTVVSPRRVESFLAPLPVRALQGVGPATERILERELGVESIEQLRTVSQSKLVARLGRFGNTLYRYARGMDERPVTPHRERKSLSAERTYGQDIESKEEMQSQIDHLAHIVGEGLSRRGIAGARVTLKARYSDFTTVTRSHTLERAVDDPQVLAQIGRQLLERTDAGERPVRLLGLGVGKLEGERRNEAQLSLFSSAPGRADSF